MPDDNQQISADDWGNAMAEQTMAAAPAATPAMDDWGAAMAEQTASTPPPAAAAQPHAFQQLNTGAAQSATHNDLEMIMDIPVQLSVELGRTRMPIKDLLQLAQGSIVELTALAGEPMDIMINGLLIAQGEVVLINEKLGIRVTDIITPSERMRRLNRL